MDTVLLRLLTDKLLLLLTETLIGIIVETLSLVIVVLLWPEAPWSLTESLIVSIPEPRSI